MELHDLLETLPPPRFGRFYEALLPAMDALPRERLLEPNLGVFAVCRRAIALVPRLSELRPRPRPWGPTSSERLLLAQSRHRRTSRARKLAASRRRQAFTLFVEAYEHVRRVVVFLRWEHGDADAYLPPLYAKARRRAARAKTLPKSSASPDVATGSAPRRSPRIASSAHPGGLGSPAQLGSPNRRRNITPDEGPLGLRDARPARRDHRRQASCPHDAALRLGLARLRGARARGP